jgi:enamine deaminase RidA (YjgF/YER057c/UK114 family)
MPEHSDAESRFLDGSIVLPEAPKPVARFERAVVGGCFLDVSGQVNTVDGALRTGTVGDDISLEEAVELAGTAAANAVAAARATYGTLEGLSVHRLRVYVVGVQGFTDQHVVANGASDYLVSLFGDQGAHARTALGVTALPLGAPVEVELTFLIS